MCLAASRKPVGNESATSRPKISRNMNKHMNPSSSNKTPNIIRKWTKRGLKLNRASFKIVQKRLCCSALRGAAPGRLLGGSWAPLGASGRLLGSIYFFFADWELLRVVKAPSDGPMSLQSPSDRLRGLPWAPRAAQVAQSSRPGAARRRGEHKSHSGTPFGRV